jgi:hypothetical protein
MTIMSEKEPPVFKPHWPDGLEQDKTYQIACDDKGHSGSCWLRVIVASDADVYVVMQDWERIDVPGSQPRTVPSVRVRTRQGGGRNHRTRQALLWLADAIRRDNEENNVDNDR